MKPLAGVMPLWDEGKDSLWMLPGYLDGLSLAGAIPLIFPFLKDEAEIKQLTDLCDGFLFTGGDDVSPSLYGQTPLEGLVSTCEKRDLMENVALKIALKEDKPVLGICRGLQFMNVALGGTLYQDLPLQHPSSTNHHGKPPYDQVVHEVEVLADTPLFDCLGNKTLGINSYHHQGIKDLAPSLIPMAVAPDGIIEAIAKLDQRFLWAVQWHPEFSYKVDENSRKIFQAFVAASKK